MGHVQARGGAGGPSCLELPSPFGLSLRRAPPAEAARGWEEPGFGIRVLGGGTGAGSFLYLTSRVFAQALILNLSFLIYKGKAVCLAGPLPELKEMMGLNRSGWPSAPNGLPEWGQVCVHKAQARPSFSSVHGREAR